MRLSDEDVRQLQSFGDYGEYAIETVAALETELDAVSTKLDAAYREIRERAGEANDLSAKLEGLGQLYDEVSTKNDGLSAQVADQAAVLARVLDGLRMWEGAPNNYDMQSCALQTIREALDSAPKQTAPDEIDWKEAYEQSRARIAELVDVADTLERERDAALSRAEAEGARVDRLSQAFHETRQRLADLRAELDAERRATKSAIAGNAVATRRAREAEAEAASLRAELNQALHASEHWSLEAAHHRDDATQLRAERDAANALLAEMREHIEQDRRPGSLFRRSGAHLSGQAPERA